MNAKKLAPFFTVLALSGCGGESPKTPTEHLDFIEKECTIAPISPFSPNMAAVQNSINALVKLSPNTVFLGTNVDQDCGQRDFMASYGAFARFKKAVQAKTK